MHGVVFVKRGGWGRGQGNFAQCPAKSSLKPLSSAPPLPVCLSVCICVISLCRPQTSVEHAGRVTATEQARAANDRAGQLAKVCVCGHNNPCISLVHVFDVGVPPCGVQELASVSSMLARLQQAVDAEKREKAEVVAELQTIAQRNAELVARVEVRLAHKLCVCLIPNNHTDSFFGLIP